MDNKHILSIEKAILSSIIFDNEQFSKIKAILKDTDFYIPEHQKIFKAMQDLDNDGIPIDETFIMQKSEVSENVIVQVLSANAITNIFAYARDIKENANKRELLKVSRNLQALLIEENQTSTKAIEQIKTQLDVISHQSNADGSWKDIINSNAKFVTEQMIKDAESASFLVQDILPKGMITTFVGVPNVGKSALCFALANPLLENRSITDLLYFDADNPLQYTKDRIEKLFNNYGNDNIKYFVGGSASTSDMLNTLEMLSLMKGGGEHVLIVIDSLKNFIDGTINDDKIVNHLFNLLQAVRDNFGATIIILHHTRKGMDDDGNLNYVGSQVILASSDNMTYISKSEVGKDLLLDNSKARAIIPPNIAVELNFEDMTLKNMEYPMQNLKQNDDEDVKLIVDFIHEKGECLSNDIKKEFKENIGAKGVQKILTRYKNQHWKFIKNDDRGWVVKAIGVQELRKEPVITEYQVTEDMKQLQDENFMDMF
jgi:replicative DNA helicase